MTTTATDPVSIYITKASHAIKRRDKYGRTTLDVISTDHRWIGAVVLLPKAARPNKGLYFSNNYMAPAQDAINYHPSRKAALARFGLTPADVRG